MNKRASEWVSMWAGVYDDWLSELLSYCLIVNKTNLLFWITSFKGFAVNQSFIVSISFELGHDVLQVDILKKKKNPSPSVVHSAHFI